MARKTKQQARETRQLILDVALRLFSQQGVSSTSLATIAKAAGVTRGAIYWRFKNKSDLFNEIWELSDASISDLEIEYRAKFPKDPLSVIREILVYVLEATVTEERRRLMMEIIYHKAAKLLPANLLTRRAAVLMRSYLSGLMEDWLFAPDSFDLHAEARDYVAILLEMYQFCPTLRGPESLSA
ncbi:MAG: TetR family transcriptional regulator [Klebsiella pneumoniae]|nr:TetR family transcriptional regulator [Klebsiella pneumoniae]